MAGALATAFQLWLSGTSNLQTVAIAMLGVHTLIGIGEALITVAALAFILQTRPDLLEDTSTSEQGNRGWIIAGVAITLVVLVLSPLASLNPDGLNRVAMDLGFIDSAQSGAGPFAGYSVPLLANPSMGKIAAGILGVAIVLLLVVLAGRSLQKKSQSKIENRK
jgi:cobalt/nickel transport system permease protein